MEYESFVNNCEYLLIVSITLNFMIFLYCTCRRVCGIIIQSSCKQNEQVRAKFYCVEKKNKKNREHVEKIIAGAIVNSMTSFVLLSLAVYTIITTDLATKPFFTFNREVEFGLGLQLSFCIFNAAILVLEEKLTKKLSHVIIKYTIASAVLCVILHTQQCSILGVIGMVMTGSIPSYEAKNVVKLWGSYETKRSNQVISIVRLFTTFLCNLLLPMIMLILPISVTSEQFFAMNSFPLSAFFLAVTFFPFYNGWLMRRITYNFLKERSKIDAIKKIQEENQAMCQMESVWTNNSVNTNKKVGFVRISKTRFIRLSSLSSFPTSTPVVNKTPVVTNHATNMDKWETIDLGED